MGSIAEMFRMGGLTAYLALATGISAFGLSMLLIVINVLPIKTRKRIALITVSLITLVAVLICFAIAIIGYFYGVDQAMGAVEKASPEHRAMLLNRGREIAWIPLKISMVLNGLPLVVAIASLVRGIRIPKNST